MITINITAEELLNLITQLDLDYSSEAGNLVNDTLINRMTPESVQEFTAYSLKNFPEYCKKIRSRKPKGFLASLFKSNYEN